jgi:hypothetical protein
MILVRITRKHEESLAPNTWPLVRLDALATNFTCAAVKLASSPR